MYIYANLAVACCINWPYLRSLTEVQVVFINGTSRKAHSIFIVIVILKPEIIHMYRINNIRGTPSSQNSHWLQNLAKMHGYMQTARDIWLQLYRKNCMENASVYVRTCTCMKFGYKNLFSSAEPLD